MAKGKSAKRNTGAKLPKTIAGMKLPKELRATVEPVLRWVDHPLVSDTLATALLVGAGALVRKKDRAGAAKGSASGARGRTTKAPKDADSIGLAIAVAAGEIAAHIVGAYNNDLRGDGGAKRAAPRRLKKTAAPKSTAARKA